MDENTAVERTLQASIGCKPLSLKFTGYCRTQCPGGVKCKSRCECNQAEPMCTPKDKSLRWVDFCNNKCPGCEESNILQKRCKNRCFCDGFSSSEIYQSPVVCTPKASFNANINRVRFCERCELKSATRRCSQKCRCTPRGSCSQQGGKCQAKPNKMKWNLFCRKKCRTDNPNEKCLKRCDC